MWVLHDEYYVIFSSSEHRLFCAGLRIPIQKIYPAIDFPVSRGTGLISPLIRWEHSEDWFVTKFEMQRSTKSGERIVKMSLNDQDYDFIVGHRIDGNLNFNKHKYWTVQNCYAVKISLIQKMVFCSTQTYWEIFQLLLVSLKWKILDICRTTSSISLRFWTQSNENIFFS